MQYFTGKPIMPYSHFSRRILVSFAAAAAIAILPGSAVGAEWRECEQAKLRELKLLRSEHQKKPKRKSARQSAQPQQSAEEIETWLWKNCREFSYELRQLEQEQM